MPSYSCFSCFHVIKVASWNHFLPLPLHQQREGTLFGCCGKNTRRCQPFHRDSHLVHSLVGKTVTFCFHAEFSYAGNKSSTCMHWGKQIPTDKAKPVVLWPCWPDFICRVGLALCHSALSKEAEFGSLIWRPPGLQSFIIFALVFSTSRLLLLSRLCWGRSWWTGEQNVCYLGSALLPASGGVTACHGGRSTIWCKPSWLIVELGGRWGKVGKVGKVGGGGR